MVGRVDMKRKLIGLAVCGLAGTVQADQFHYNNVLVGTRAVGLGGAFAGVSDDASGMYYNPAGLAFALSNDIQGSANAFYKKETVYQKTIGEMNFTEQSSGSLTPFFGGLQKLDRYVDGLVAAFGLYYIDGDLKDQDDLIESKVVGSSTIERFHRTVNSRANTYYGGIAVGYRPKPTFSVGFGLNYYRVDELLQEFQFAKQSVTITGQTDPGAQILTVNTRQKLDVHGVQPTLGIQTALPGNLALGLTLKQGIIASQTLTSVTEQTATVLTAEQNATINADRSVSPAAKASQLVSNLESKNPVGAMPMEARVGVAWFASPTLLWAFDTTYHAGVTNADKKADPAQVRAPYNKEAVTNFATGVEWYPTASVPVRFGLFTNNDSRPNVNKPSSSDKATGACSLSKYPTYYKKFCGQPDHIDYMGASLFLGWVQPSSQISGGITYQSGKGQAQKLGNDVVQDVKSTQYSLALSVTHNL